MSGRKWTFGGLAGAVALAWGVGGLTAQPPAAGSKPPAVVNGEAISQADLEAALRQAGPTPVQLPEAQRKQLVGQALGYLIDQALMRQFLARNGVAVDANEVNRKVAEMEAALRTQKKTLQDFCRETNQTEEQLRTGIGGHVQWQTYARQHLTEADVEQFYKDNKDFFDRTTVRASHILLRLPATATESERAQARAKLTELRGQILAGKADFAEAAKAHSQCPTAEKGGDLGFILRKWMVEEPFARTAFALPVGQVSDVVETEFGLHLIKATDRKPGQPSDYSKIKEQVVEICIQDLFFNVLAQQRKAAKVEVNLP
jgi:parvulin-like peptidyl-prolyl isomerase